MGALRKSNTHFARCGSYRTGEVPLGSRCKGNRLTVPTSANWLSIRNAMMVQDADCTLPWIGEVRLQSNRRLLIT